LIKTIFNKLSKINVFGNIMKWLEIINFQFVGDQGAKFKTCQLIPLIKQAQTEYQLTLHLFRNAIIEDDLSIHIVHKTYPVLETESPLSVMIRSALKDFGLSNYSRWIKEITD
jgi:hypothetical protein